jgi:hypothetical protein
VTTLAGWLGAPPRAASLDELVLRYLRAFGPASPADVRAWSGLGDVRALLERLQPGLRVYRDEEGRRLYDAGDGVLVDPATPAPVRLLPQFDNVFLGHADRGRIMERVRWDSWFAHRGTIFVDGFLGGAWKLSRERGGATLALELRTRIGREARSELGLEAERLLAFMAADAPARRVQVAGP